MQVLKPERKEYRAYASINDAIADHPEAYMMYKADTMFGELWAADMHNATMLLRNDLSIVVYMKHHSRGWEKK
jgi:hypothetical protein